MKEQKIRFTPIPSTAEVEAERERLAYRSRYMRVLRSTAQWHGVTYKEDKPALMASIERMIAEGKYPRNLWK